MTTDIIDRIEGDIFDRLNLSERDRQLNRETAARYAGAGEREEELERFIAELGVDAMRAEREAESDAE